MYSPSKLRLIITATLFPESDSSGITQRCRNTRWKRERPAVAQAIRFATT